MPAEGFNVSLTGFEAPEIDLLLADMAPYQLCLEIRQRDAGICGDWEKTGSCAVMREKSPTSPA